MIEFARPAVSPLSPEDYSFPSLHLIDSDHEAGHPSKILIYLKTSPRLVLPREDALRLQRKMGII
jgi:hypothetical protein